MLLRSTRLSLNRVLHNLHVPRNLDFVVGACVVVPGALWSRRVSRLAENGPSVDNPTPQTTHTVVRGVAGVLWRIASLIALLDSSFMRLFATNHHSFIRSVELCGKVASQLSESINRIGPG